MDKGGLPQGKEYVARCPSCGERTTFEYLGTQRWPQAVAERTNRPLSVELYQCRNCATTISAPNLEAS